MAYKTEDPSGSKGPMFLPLQSSNSQEHIPQEQLPGQKQLQSKKGAQEGEHSKKEAEEGEQNKKLSTLETRFVTGWRRFVLWFKTVYLIKKEYVPGDTCRFIWQKVPEVQSSFVYYRVAHMIANLLVLCIAVFHISMPNNTEFCANEPVFCIGSHARAQLEWFFYATSWGVMINFVQSVWGLGLTFRLYACQRTTQGMVKDVGSPDGASAIDQTSALKKDKNVGSSGKRRSRNPEVSPHSPSHSSVEGSQSKDAGPVKPSVWVFGVKQKTLLSEDAQQINDLAGGKRLERGGAPSKTLSQDKTQTTVPAGPNIFIGRAPSKTLSQDKTQTTVPAGPKTVQTKAGQEAKKPKDTESPGLESGAGPSATKEHKVISRTGFYWGLHSYAVSSSLLIDTVYWTLIWPNLPTSPQVQLIQFDEHAFNLPLMITDYCLVAFPRELSHLWFTNTISFFYVMVNCVYYFAGGLSEDRRKRYLYSFLDWENPVQSVVFGLSIGVATSIYFLVLLTIDHYKFKLRPKALINNAHKSPSP